MIDFVTAILWKIGDALRPSRWSDIFSLRNKDVGIALAGIVLAVLLISLLVTCSSEARAGEWQYPTAALYLGVEKDDAFGRNPVGYLNVEQCYRFGGGRHSACYGYSHMSSAPDLDDRMDADVFYGGYKIELRPLW